MGLMNLLVKDSEVKELRSKIDELLAAKRKITEELEELKLKKRLEEEEIRHLQRIEQEKNKQEVASEKLTLERAYAEKITQFKEEQRQTLVKSLREFHQKMEDRFSSELGNLKDVYNALISRLPNVNLSLTKKLK